ncbi:aminofutalosine synthase MqnE [Calditerrivibrio nitroreducens]|uniref:Aminodeoxyfutalosine synthase n=1 Tax=Calditerrivibrio nitroreducens (strain DSM 19672 / NBRC 101217 / Yu37-1) TaxID=768670 RepID=E4TFH2_CALNY|nr:aminofutalosine synthase MqnE [Calditerrivibrio nitroreducens]ADR19545.1 Radical SAM domain protein [Calditerrivibrio nitroreducens DSM 19672]
MKSLFKDDIISLGKKALEIKRSLWGDKVFFVKNIHLNYTNICINGCKFCAFAKDESDAEAYEYTINDVIDYLKQNCASCKEVHIVGGLHPHFKFDYYLNMLRAIKSNFPGIAVKAFSAVEIDYFTKISGLSTEKVLIKLKEAGLDMMPGGGAEIFAEGTRNEICPEKISAERWLEIMEIAHNQGIKTNATMLYGHIESEDDIIDHLLKLRKLQEKTGGFNAFIPLSFHPENTFLNHLYPSTGVEDIKIISISRIILDNIPHIKGYWVMLGEKTAQVALYFGADDLDGTIVKEKITHSAGASSKEGLTESELIYMIKSAGFIPVERDSFYNEIKIY